MLTGSHLDSVLDGGAYDGPLGVVSALAAIDVLRSRGFEPSRPDRRLGVHRGGRVALRARLPGLPPRHRRLDVGRCPRAPGSRRGLPRRRHRGCRPRPVEGTAVARRRRLLRRAARRTGPRPRRPRRRRRRGQRDLAARALPLRLRGRGQPRRHDPDGGPPRPDAHLRDDRAGRQQAGTPRGTARHLRSARGCAQRHQRRAVPGHGLAGRPVLVRRRSGRAGRGDLRGRAPTALRATGRS